MNIHFPVFGLCWYCSLFSMFTILNFVCLCLLSFYHGNVVFYWFMAFYYLLIFFTLISRNILKIMLITFEIISLPLWELLISPKQHFSIYKSQCDNVRRRKLRDIEILNRISTGCARWNKTKPRLNEGMYLCVSFIDIATHSCVKNTTFMISYWTTVCKEWTFMACGKPILF